MWSLWKYRFIDISVLIKSVHFSHYVLPSLRLRLINCVTVLMLLCLMLSGQAAVVSKNASKHHGSRGSWLQGQEPVGSACCSQQLWSSHICRQNACRHDCYWGCCHGDEVWSVWSRRVNSYYGYKRSPCAIVVCTSEMLFTLLSDVDQTVCQKLSNT